MPADILTVPTKSGISENTLFYGVRSRLLWFTWTVYSYLTDLVIDPNTKQMCEALGEADDVDQMIDIHRDYMKKLTDQTLLGSKLTPIHQTVISILDLSIQLMGESAIACRCTSSPARTRARAACGFQRRGWH